MVGLTEAFDQALPALQAAPDGAYILSHNRKAQSNQLTNFIISLPGSAAYALLFTLDSFIKIPLPTRITVRGQPHTQTVNLNIAPQMHIILERNYRQLQTDPEITALNPHSHYYYSYWLQHPGNGVLGDVLRVRLIWEPYGPQALCRSYPPNPSPPVFVCTRIFRVVL